MCVLAFVCFKVPCWSSTFEVLRGRCYVDALSLDPADINRVPRWWNRAREAAGTASPPSVLWYARRLLLCNAQRCHHR